MTQIAIEGDPSTQQDAPLTEANCDDTVTYEGKLVAVVNGALEPTHNHGDTQYISAPSEGSNSVTIAGNKIHRVGDGRTCGTHKTDHLGEPRTVNIFD